uniref:Ras-GEF domain-containing protein n=1 Tax=Anolis carolinensis TaxID=28377 RepID=H9G9W7_ANOCA
VVQLKNCFCGGHKLCSIDGNLEISNCEEDRSQNSPENKTGLRTAMASVLKAWLIQCPEDFRGPPDHPCLQKLLAYLTQVMPGSELEGRAQNLLEKFQKQEVANGAICDTLANEEELETEGSEDFSSFAEDFVAEQLTSMDAELFKRVVPYHCLGSIWSQRNKKENSHLALTVRATVAQFNAVTQCVIRTILNDKELDTQQRAKIIEKWIAIAHECRILKNFSSLRAIVAALQSNSIYRLKKCWASVAKDSMLMFEELSEIFSECDNYLISRELLMREGTSKFANLDSNRKENQKRIQGRLQLQKDMGVMHGTVPYLGTFLTDLTMLDGALQNYVEGGLINFEKRRREFEVIAQIKLLQSSCNSYCMKTDRRFIRWFKKEPYLTEEESYTLAREIDTTTTSVQPRKGMAKGLRWLFQGCTGMSLQTLGQGWLFNQDFDSD